MFHKNFSLLCDFPLRSVSVKPRRFMKLVVKGQSELSVPAIGYAKLGTRLQSTCSTIVWGQIGVYKYLDILQSGYTKIFSSFHVKVSIKPSYDKNEPCCPPNCYKEYFN